jgi:hypothetical protein
VFSFPNIVFKHPVALIYHLFHIYFPLKYTLFSFPSIVFKHPVVLIYHLFLIYIPLKYTLLYIHSSSILHGSAVYGHHQVSCILLKLLQCCMKAYVPSPNEYNSINVYNMEELEVLGSREVPLHSSLFKPMTCSTY